MATKVKLIDNTISPTLAGGTFTSHVHLGDSDQIRWGDSNDGTIHHDGSHFRLRVGTGNFNVQANDFHITDASNSSVRFSVDHDGATRLYHNATQKLETSSAGATVSGTLTVTGDLDITGNVNSASVTDLDVTDKTITLGVGQTEAQSGSSGIIIDGSGASILWDETNDEFVINKNVKHGAIQLSEDTTSYALDATLSYYSASNGVYLNGPGTNGWLRLNASGVSNSRTAIDLYGQNQGDYIKMKAGNTDALWINSAGNTGLGESSPQRKLHVDSGTTNVVARFESSDNIAAIELKDNGGSAEVGCSNNDLVFFPAGAEKVRIDSSGRVGIGTSQPSGYHAKGDNLVIATPGVGDTGMTIVSSSSLTGRIFFADGTSGGAESMGQIKYDHGSDFMSLHTSDNERLRIHSSGHVSIKGSANASADGLSNLTLGNGSGSAGLSIYSGAASVSRLMFADGTSGGAQYDGFIAYEHTAQKMGLGVAGTGGYKMIIDSVGDVLIGQTSQTGYTFAQKLVVGDGNGNDGITIQSGSTHQGNLAFNHSSGTTAHGRISYQHNSNYMTFFTNNTERMRIGPYGMRVDDGEMTVEQNRPLFSGANASSYSSSTNLAYTKSTDSYPVAGEALKARVRARAYTKYIHMKTNLTSENVMFFFRMFGYFYNYGVNECVRGGYTYNGGVIQESVANAYNTNSNFIIGDYYRSSSGGFLCLRLDVHQTGYTEGEAIIMFGSHSSTITRELQITDMQHRDDGNNAY